MTKATITLAGQSYEIGPLTLKQLREIGIGTAKWASPVNASAAASEAAWYDGTFQMLAAVLGKPQEEIENMSGITIPDLVTANAKILETAGLRLGKAEDDGQPKLGEANGA